MSYIKLIHNAEVILMCQSVWNPKSTDGILMKLDTNGLVP